MILATVLVAVPALTVSEPGTVLSTYILMTTAIVMMMKMLLLLSCDVDDDYGGLWQHSPELLMMML